MQGKSARILFDDGLTKGRAMTFLDPQRIMTTLLIATIFAASSSVGAADIVVEQLVELEPVQIIQLDAQAQKKKLIAVLKDLNLKPAKDAEHDARMKKWQAEVAATEAELKRAEALYEQFGALAKEGKGDPKAVKAFEKMKVERAALKGKLAALQKAKPQQKQQVKLIVAAQAEEAKPEEAKPDDKKPNEGDPATVPPAVAAKKADLPVDPLAVQLKMSDGTIIHGKLQSPTIAVDTKFGRLEIPIAKIRYFRPGLNSHPDRKAEINNWLDKLGSDDTSQRKVATDALKKLGQPARTMLEPFAADANATRAAAVKEILNWLSDQDDAEEFEMGTENVIRFEDTIATTEFTMTGSILQESFTLKSEFGVLQMQLKDIVQGERDTGQPEMVRKAFSIDQTNLCARGFKKIGIRVEKGDRISIRATGTIGMLRWGSNAVATPEGAPNYGWYVSSKIANGALCAKIGSGSVFKVGSKYKATAKQAGLLEFGIGITDRYAKSTSYKWPGSFKVRVEIERD